MPDTFKTHKWLKPLAMLYGSVTDIRNMMFDKGLVASYRAGIPTICIGNITAGGTGKTPHTEYLANLLREKFRTAILSRGYGRKSRGYIMADENATPSLIGDEPYQMSRKFPDVSVAVCEKRAEGLRRLESVARPPEVVILDDAFQHRAVTPSLGILLIDFNRDIHDDMLLPAGLLRESVKGKERADIIIVTKCPQDISEMQMRDIRARISPTGGQKVFFSTLRYGEIRPLRDDGEATLPPTVSSAATIIAVTGIASPKPMLDYLEQKAGTVIPMVFPDHHDYTSNDLRRMKDAVSTTDDAIIITTGKDAVKLASMHIGRDLLEKIYVLPVGIDFISGKEQFDNIIINHIRNFNKQQYGTH